MSRQLRIAVLGHGPVARAFLTLVAGSHDDLARRHALELAVSGIRAARGQVLLSDDAVPPREQWSPTGELADFLAASRADLLVQAIPSRDDLVEIAREQVLAGFHAGMDVVTATKSHLVREWATLQAAAVAADRRIRISASTGAALPAADLARVSLRGFACDRIRAAVNGTSNFVLDQMAAGRSLDEAVAEARSLGIAEADVASDLDGRDAASKITLLANLLWNRGVVLDQVTREPIEASTAPRAARAARQGLRLRAVGVAVRGSGALSVRFEELDQADPLFALRGPEKAVAFDCGAVGQIVVAGGKASPLGAAHALLRDVLNLALEGHPGFD